MPNEEMNLPVEGQEPTGPLTPGGDDTPRKPKDEPKDEDKANEL